MRGLGPIAAATTRGAALQRAANLAVEVFQAESAVITLLADGGERFESYSSPDDRTTTVPGATPFLGVPLACHGVVRGSLYLTGTPESTFTSDDEHLAVILTGCAATALDRLDWEAERERLTHSHQRLFTTLSHDLGNAMTAIYGWGDILVRRLDPAAVPQAAYELMNAAEGAIGLLHDTVDLTRLEFHELVPAIAAVEASEVFENVMSRAQPAARTHAVRLRQATAPLALRIRTDRRRLEQLLVHLLIDLIDHSERGATIEVSSTTEGDHLVIVMERLEDGPSSDSTGRSADEAGATPDRGLALWQRIGAHLGISVTVPHGYKRRPGYRIAATIEHS
jgi:signal transduction histidine kinase